jgi:hypothetical protein
MTMYMYQIQGIDFIIWVEIWFVFLDYISSVSQIDFYLIM